MKWRSFRIRIRALLQRYYPGGAYRRGYQAGYFDGWQLRQNRILRENLAAEVERDDRGGR